MQRLVYLILGAPDSGRREIVLDIMAEGLPDKASSLALVHGNLPQEPQFAAWSWEKSAFHLPDEATDPKITHLFLILSPTLDLADQIEAILELLSTQDELSLGRIIFVVRCNLLKDASVDLQSWYDACAHFSDVALLHRREGVSNRIIRDFEQRYQSMRYPMLVELTRKNRVANPARILDPTPRRISHAFDPIDIEGPTNTTTIDPYLERLPNSQRTKPIPAPFT